jgi:predicted ATPase/class 3 adenylate cyclase
MEGVAQPSGTVTLVFTDIEGSTRLLAELGDGAYLEALDEHRRAVRDAFGRYRGYEVDTQGDSFFYAFASARDAASAVEEAMAALAGGPIRIRVGIHTGEPVLDPPNYAGLDVHRAARIMAAGHGGQVLVSRSTRDLLDDSVVLADLGDHRLKDLSSPQRLFQLGSAEFPALKTLHRTNLPVPATAFIGREHELRELAALLSDGVRLLTLTGPGGTGKTRLATQTAAESSDAFPDGVWWVGLAPARDPAAIPSLVAATLGLREEPGVELLDTIAGGLEGRRCLVLLDNVEHLLPDAADHLARLASVDGPTFLVTSRERLQLTRERVYPVPTLSRTDGLELFHARVAALGAPPSPDEAASLLCARLDDLPLAIELAAARTVVLSAEQIYDRLSARLDLAHAARDVDPRQRTLRATVEWSYQLLEPVESELFARLSVFAGGCTLEAAETVCLAELDALASLVDKSLVRRDHERFWMLETIREFAAEQLDAASDGETVREAWASYFLTLAERAEPELWSVDQGHWLELLDAEHANVRAVLVWALAVETNEIALRLAAALEPFWEARGHIDDGRQLMTDALARSGRDAPTARAKALFGLSRLLHIRREIALEQSVLEEAVELARDARATRELVFSLSHLGMLINELGDTERAAAFFDESIALARAHENPWLTAMAANNYGYGLLILGDIERARPLIEEAVALRRTLGEPRGLMVSLGSRAELALSEHDYEAATPLLNEALSLARKIGHREGELFALSELGIVRLMRNDPSGARAALAESLRGAGEIGFLWVGVMCLAGFAALAQLHGEASLAARLWGAVDALVESASLPPQAETRPLYESFLPLTRSELGEAGFELAAAEGAQLTFEKASALALLGRDDGP